MLYLLSLILIIASAYAGQWPKGSYTLVKPRSGCPSGWWEGWRKQDNEDERPNNGITFGHNFYGSFGKDMVFYYCTKDGHVPGTEHWPKGNYCILRQGVSCPPGFHMGSVLWDDEDKRNSNDGGGVLPSGTYNKDTLINYCCRNDGSPRTKITLPTDVPFYLLRFRSSCQEVQGMRVKEEHVKSDDEDNRNKSSVSGYHPMRTGGKDTMLYYCYYY
ncbi:uncharacterized protein LOC134723741 [Mytilus trossulus]|uniref:uncharacterized protein LOC134723741 n=1 Tax=Mytilus trossulus TaxID=6551 RepID=UPI0030075FE8